MSEPLDAPSQDEMPLVLRARGLVIDGVDGPVVEGLDLDLQAGGFCVVQGPDGSGKTSVLLTLAGRMPFRAGTLEVAGHTLPRGRSAVQHVASLAEMRGVNDLDDSLTVAAHIAERLSVRTLMPWARRRDVEAVMDRFVSTLVAARRDGPVQGPRTHIGPDWQVIDLTGVERELLGVVLGLVGDPAILVVDENGEIRSADDRRAVAAGLGHLSRTARVPFVTIAASTEPVETDRLADLTGLPVDRLTVVDLGPGPADPFGTAPVPDAPVPVPAPDPVPAPPVAGSTPRGTGSTAFAVSSPTVADDADAPFTPGTSAPSGAPGAGPDGESDDTSKVVS